LTISYNSGRRIQGTSTDATAVSGGWKELGRISGSRTINNSLTVSSLADKRYYMILGDTQGTSTFTTDVRLNGDSGNNYSIRQSVNGASDATYQNLNNMNFDGTGQGTDKFGVGYIANLSTKEKLYQSHVVQRGSVGAGNDPKRGEFAGKWANTSNAITSIGLVNRGNGTSTGGELVVLGWDPDDTHTDNFWEELASVNGDGTADFDTGTFTAKKYLWIQAFLDRSSNSNNTQFQVGNSTLDTGSNYSRRRNENGGTDELSGGSGESYMNMATYSTKEFHNFFVINNSGNEKLFICHSNLSSTAGNIPNRLEGVYKWANTSNQINIFGVNSGGANTLSSSSQIKVWGSN
jgi:hypothetical protein